MAWFGSGSAWRWRAISAKASSQPIGTYLSLAGVVGHRMRQAALVLEPEIALLGQLPDGVLREQLGAGPPGGRLGRHGLGTVLAELEGRGMVAVGPGAAGAVEAIGLVGRQQGPGPLQRDALRPQRLCHAAQRTPAAGAAPDKTRSSVPAWRAGVGGPRRSVKSNRDMPRFKMEMTRCSLSASGGRASPPDGPPVRTTCRCRPGCRHRPAGSRCPGR